MLSEALVELQKLSDAQSRQKERHGQSGGVHCEQQDPASNGVAGRRQRQDGRENRADARGPAECESKSQKKSLRIPGLVLALRKCTSRFSHLASAGPKNPIIDSEKKCTHPIPKKSGPWRKIATTPNSTSAMPRSIPMRKLSFINAPSRCSPNSKISAPATGASNARFCRRNVPTALADAPNEMNTTEKPTTNESAEPKSPPRGC